MCSAFEHLPDIGFCHKTADQTEHRFDLIFPEHGDRIAHQIRAEASPFRFDRTPVSPDTPGSDADRPHIPECSLVSAGNRQECIILKIRITEHNVRRHVRSDSTAG